jgi:Flp pilus assembly protein TadD
MTELLQTHRDTVRESQVDDLNRQAINHYGNGEYDLALEALERAREIQEDRPEILANLGHVYAALGEMDKAEASFRSALEADPDLEPALSGLGALLVTDGRPDETIEFLRSFVEEAEPSSSVLLAYTRALAAQGSHARAVELLKKALQTDPGNPEIEEELGRYTD